MNRSPAALIASLFILFVLSTMSSAQAQAVRTWVSGVGDDVNPCSRTAPCKTFAGAISKTAAGGEIGVLDPGGFGAVTITKSISIVAQGVEGSVLAASINGIIINAGPSDVVSLRGLLIEGAQTGLSGIRILQAGSVYISNTVIRGFMNASSGYGVDIEPPSNGPLVYLRNVEINNNRVGIYMHAGPVVSGVVMESCTIAANSVNSAIFDSANSTGRAQGSSFANTPVSVTNGAKLISNGNNFFAGGTGPTSTSALQ